MVERMTLNEWAKEINYLSETITSLRKENAKLTKRIAELEASKKRVIDQLHAHDLSHEIAIKEKDKHIAELEDYLKALHHDEL